MSAKKRDLVKKNIVNKTTKGQKQLRSRKVAPRKLLIEEHPRTAEQERLEFSAWLNEWFAGPIEYAKTHKTARKLASSKNYHDHEEEDQEEMENDMSDGNSLSVKKITAKA